MSANYSYQGSMDNAAKAYGRRLRISTKQSIEVCKAIKGLHINDARDKLQAAVDEEEPIEFTRYSEGAGHKGNGGMGKYPVKTCEEILNVLKSAEANAQHQGLSSDLLVEHVAAHQAQQNTKYGRHAGRTEKGTHVEVIVKEAPGAERPEQPSSDEPTGVEDVDEAAVPDVEESDESDRGEDESAREADLRDAGEEAEVSTSKPDVEDEALDESIDHKGEGGSEPDSRASTGDETEETPPSEAEDTEGVDESETSEQEDATGEHDESDTDKGQPAETSQELLEDDTESTPDESWTVPEIQDWLDNHDIDYTSDDLKDDLLEKTGRKQ